MKKIFIAIAIILLVFTTIIDAKIPEYKGLHTIFTEKTDAPPATDTIGIGLALSYSNWLENVYTYATQDNAARKVIAQLWFKRLKDKGENFIEDNSFDPSIKHPASCVLKPKDFGILIKYIREFNKNNEDGTKKCTEQLDEERDAIKLTNKGKADRKKLTEFVKSLEELKFNDKFIPEMAECILWASFDRKENWREKEFKECLDEIDKNYWIKLQDKKTQANSYSIDETINKTIIENTAKKLIKNQTYNDNLVIYDALTRYIIKFAKTKRIPYAVSQAYLKYKDKKTCIETQRFTTCFESAILDLISALIYDRDQMLYNPDILPEKVTENMCFKHLIDAVFKTLPDGKKTKKDKLLILSENINKKEHIQEWINLITNLDILTYNKNIDNISYDLTPSLENFIKILNIFFNLGLVVTDKVDTLEITLNNNDKTIVKKNKLNSWNPLFEIISKKLSTKTRPVKFSITKMPKIIKTSIIKNCDKSITIGSIYMTIGETELILILNERNAHINCSERDKSQLADKKLHKLKSLLIAKLISNINENKNLIPLFIFLPYINIIYNNPKLEELLYYSFELKENKTKLNFLNKIFTNEIEIIKRIYSNESIRELISKLIDILSKDEDLKYALISLLIEYEDKDKKSCWQDLIEAKISGILDPQIAKALAQENKTELLKIFEEITFNSKIVNKFLKKILETILISPNVQNETGKTAIFIACLHNKANIVKALLEYEKIDINHKGINDDTPLHTAAEDGHTEIVKLLLKHPKININAENIFNKNPKDFAFKQNHEDIVKLFEEHEKTKSKLK